MDYKEIFENIALGIIVVDEEFNINKINTACINMLGFQGNELLGICIKNSSVLDYIGLGHRLYELLKKGKKRTFKLKTKYKRKDDSTFFGLVNINANYDENGRFLSAIISLEDVSELMEEQENLKKTKDQFKLLFDYSLNPIILMDLEEGFKQINPAFCKMLGYTHEECLGLSMYDITVEEDLQKSIQCSNKLKSGEIKNFKLEKRYYHKDGSIVYAITLARSVFDKHGKLIGTITSFKDVTIEKEREQTINRMISELSEKNEVLHKYIQCNLQLENFAYVASHNLKAPLRTIISFSQLLNNRYKEIFEKDGLDYLNYIIRGTKTLDLIIKDLLSYSQLNTQQLHLQTIVVPQLIEVIQKSLNKEIQKTSATLLFQNLPSTLQGDRCKITQLFHHLIENAIKYKRTEILPVIKIAYEEQQNHHQFAISDNGIGIEPAYHERIFLLFRKLQGQKYAGSGIGLSICKKIIEQHNGKIWVESTMNQGTTFYFTIHKNLLAEKQLTMQNLTNIDVLVS